MAAEPWMFGTVEWVWTGSQMIVTRVFMAFLVSCRRGHPGR